MTARWAPHACRHCLGGLLERVLPDGRSVFECGTCSVTAAGAPETICGCGILPKPLSARSAGPRFRCVPNPNRCVASPAAYVIAFDEASP